MLITQRQGPSAHSLLRKSVDQLEGFRSHNRFIIFSEVTSNTIPDIIDAVFNLMPGGTSFLSNDNKKTKVVVINQSEVYGDAHGHRDTRTRNCYMHYGFADCSLNQISGDTMITFTDMDWNVIADKPWNADGGRFNLGADINLSYDVGATGASIFRDTNNYKEILIPSPEFYDEKDMLLLGDKEENYNEDLVENKSFNLYNSFDTYYNNLYRLKLNDLVDDHTRIFKLTITIENLTNSVHNYTSDENINDLITEIASEIKYAMESCGFSSGEVDLGGSTDGFNFTNMKSYLRMEKEERYFHSRMFVSKLDELSETYYDIPFVLMFNIRYDRVNVRVIDKNCVFNNEAATDENTLDLSQKLKVGNSYLDM